MTSISSSLDLLSDLVTFSTMVSCIPEDNITQDKIVPMRRNSVYTILVEVELRHDGQHAQQQLATVGQQQHAHVAAVQTMEPILFREQTSPQWRRTNFFIS